MEGVVRIRGSDPDAVFRAREIMEFQVLQIGYLCMCACVCAPHDCYSLWLQVLRIPIKSSEVPIIRGHDGSNLADIQSSAGVIGMVIEPVS